MSTWVFVQQTVDSQDFSAFNTGLENATQRSQEFIQRNLLPFFLLSNRIIIALHKDLVKKSTW